MRRKLYGNDSQGPFSLNERVVEGSERVRVNKQKMAKGRDYEIDYLVGEIRFTNKIIEDTDLLEVEYEYQPDGHSRRLYGGRFVHHPWKSLSYGMTLVDDRDKADRAAYDAFGNSPTAISVGAFDTAIRPFKGTELKGEVAGSIYDPNLLSEVTPGGPGPEAVRIEGGAYRSQGHTTMGPFRFGGGYKRVEPNFSNPGNLSLRQDMTSWNSNAAFKHKGRFSSSVSYQEDDYVNVDSRENITTMKGDASATGAPAFSLSFGKKARTKIGTKYPALRSELAINTTSSPMEPSSMVPSARYHLETNPATGGAPIMESDAMPKAAMVKGIL